MSENPATTLPKQYVRVWVMTSTGERTTAYVNASGEWVFICKRIAAEQPTVISWRS